MMTEANTQAKLSQKKKKKIWNMCNIIYGFGHLAIKSARVRILTALQYIATFKNNTKVQT